MSSETLATIAVFFAGLTFLGNLLKDVFGGSKNLTQQFYQLELKTDAAIQKLKDEFNTRVALGVENSRIGFDAITSNIHELRLANANFRADVSNEYIKWRDFEKLSGQLKAEFTEKHTDLKKDMHDGFDRLESAIEAVTLSVESARRDRLGPQSPTKG